MYLKKRDVKKVVKLNKKRLKEIKRSIKRVNKLMKQQIQFLNHDALTNNWDYIRYENEFARYWNLLNNENGDQNIKMNDRFYTLSIKDLH